MSENIEIFKDNYVLDECDFDIIDAAFLDYLKACSNAGKEYLIMEVEQIKLKINKLNDWYKNTHLEKIETEADPEFAEVE